MAEFTAKDVQDLRRSSGAGMMDAKRALQENDGDREAAERWLREKGLSSKVERSGRASEQGAVSAANQGYAAALVELKSETDYVAKSPEFRALVDELAAAVAAEGPEAAAKRQDEVDSLAITLKENISVGRVVHYEAPEGAVLDTYLHVQNDRGVSGVMVELVGGDRALAHDVALHVASMRPQWLTREDVPAERVAEEREVLETLSRNEGKPEQALPKIVEGRLNGFFKDHVLLEQSFVKDNKQTISQLLGDARVSRFARVEIGRE